MSARELETLRLIADGLTNQEIADRLVLSLLTVKWHTGNLYGNLGVNSRTQAAARARELGILTPEFFSIAVLRLCGALWRRHLPLARLYFSRVTTIPVLV